MSTFSKNEIFDSFQVIKGVVGSLTTVYTVPSGKYAKIKVMEITVGATTPSAKFGVLPYYAHIITTDGELLSDIFMDSGDDIIMVNIDTYNFAIFEYTKP